jgi:3-hydroxybutyryl-CoA dehydrogenase
VVLKKETPGYLFNSMFMALTKNALNLAARGVATVEDIDRSWMGVTKMRIGPLGMLDLVGLDTAMTISRHWGTVLNDPENLGNASFLAKYVDQGLLGVKSGQGFYKYPNPVFQDPSFLDPQRDQMDRGK